MYIQNHTKIDKATEGAKKLYDLIKRENNGLDLHVIIPMFTSTTGNIAIFSFEGAFDASKGEGFTICKDDDNRTRSSYTKNTASIDSKRDICTYHTMPSNTLGNVDPFYATVHGLSLEELHMSTFPSVLYYPSSNLNLAMAVIKTYQTRQNFS